MKEWLKKSFETNANPDAAKITAFLAFGVCIVLAGIDQLTQYKINETVFITFAGIAGTGLGVTAFKK